MIHSILIVIALGALIYAPSIAKAQSTGQTICRDVWVPGRVGAINPNEKAHSERVCNTVYSPQPSAPQPTTDPPKVEHTTGSSETVQYDVMGEARKARLRASEPQTPPSSGLCPPPYRMTARDGCQK
jgi:hypothetical protein